MLLSRMLPAALSLLALAAPTLSEAVKDREGAVRLDKATLENDPRWNYNDPEKAFAEARRTGKPVLVVLRCVPCLACAGIDAQLLMDRSEVAPLLDQFVCVRVINANTLDLSRYQFDYDLSFSAFFFNADGTLYGRYGSWAHQMDTGNKATAGLQQTLEAALALHKGYPGNKAQLAGKQGQPFPFKTPVEIPTLSAKYKADLDWNGKVVPSCVHCHQIGDAMRLTYREKKQPIPTEWIFPFPAPETIGLTLSPDFSARIASIAPGSPAEKAGLKVGDDLTQVAGQPVISIADVSWALHRFPGRQPLLIGYRRGNLATQAQLELPEDWRKKGDISHRVGTWPMRGMALGGLVIEDLDDAARKSRSLDAHSMVLTVKSVGQYGKHAAAKNAGFQKDDVLVNCAGLSNRMSEGELIAHLLQEHQAGEKVPVTVLRGEQKVELTMPMQ